MDACVNLVIYEYTVKIYSPVVFMHSFFCCDQTKGSLLKLSAAYGLTGSFLCLTNSGKKRLLQIKNLQQPERMWK